MLRGTIQMRKGAIGAQAPVFVLTDMGEEYDLLSWNDGTDIERLVDAPLEVSGSITLQGDGKPGLMVEQYRLLFPLQSEFDDFWYLQ